RLVRLVDAKPGLGRRRAREGELSVQWKGAFESMCRADRLLASSHPNGVRKEHVGAGEIDAKHADGPPPLENLFASTRKIDHSLVRGKVARVSGTTKPIRATPKTSSQGTIYDRIQRSTHYYTCG